MTNVMYGPETTIVDDTYYVVDGSIPTEFTHKPVDSKSDTKFTFSTNVDLLLIQTEAIRRVKEPLATSGSTTRSVSNEVRMTGRKVPVRIPIGTVVQYFPTSKGSGTLCFAPEVNAGGRIVQLNVMRSGSFGIRSYTR